MPADPVTPLPVRASDRERDSVARTLRDRAAEGRLSLDTFSRRLERLHAARDREQLRDLVRDLPPRGWFLRLAACAAGAASALAHEVELAWMRPRVPCLELPADREEVTIGRSPSCDYQIGDPFVSRCHARLRWAGDAWVIEDRASVNGTRVNGLRVVGPAQIRRGDLVTLGRVHIRLG